MKNTKLGGKDLSDNGAVIFLVSHDFEFINHTCTKVFDMDAGQGGKMLGIGELKDIPN